jgi:hypothetical protein
LGPPLRLECDARGQPYVGNYAADEITKGRLQTSFFESEAQATSTSRRQRCDVDVGQTVDLAASGEALRGKSMALCERVFAAKNIQSRYRLGFFSLDEEPVVIKCATSGSRFYDYTMYGARFP